MLAIFMFINVVVDRGVATTTTIPVIVGGLSVAASNSTLTNCDPPSTLPADIAPGLLVPVDTTSRGPFRIPNAGAGDFDCSQPLTSSANPSSLLGFYKAQLGARGWTLFSSGAANGAPQYLFQKAGSDTFYWIIGITVNHFDARGTAWTYRIYQNSQAI